MASYGLGVSLGLLLVAMLAGHAAAAAWYESIAVSNLASTGQILFITAGKNYLYLYKGLNVQPVLGSTIPKPQQSLKASSGYPNAAFTLQIQGMAVIASGSKVTLSKTDTPTQWNIDTYYRVSPNNFVTCLDVDTVVGANARLVIKACSKLASQQWNFLPATNPPKGITNGFVQTADESQAKMCLTEGAAADASTPDIKAVTLTPCTGVATQKLTSSGERTNNQNFNTGIFELKFGSGRCLHVFCPGCADGAPRETATIVAAACTNEFPDGFYYRWYYNSRGQLQSDAVAGGNGVPVCLDVQSGAVAAGPCSYKTASNRWTVSAPSW